jgi:hemoglobin-like flavoprotein
MFPIQMSGQRDKLVAALGAVVSSVDELDTVLPLLEQLGRDHRRFAVADWQAVCSASS